MNLIKTHTILDKIIDYKREQELPETKKNISVDQLKESSFFDRETHSLSKNLLKNELGIIAEFKRKSPSKGMINETEDIEKVCKGYEESGAAAISVLTDENFFAGSNEYLKKARKSLNIPILRKDFIFDDYQVYEAKSIGADAILLIASVLTAEKISELNNLAHELGLETLLEIHNEEELKATEHIKIDVIGINNRSLKTFETTLDHSKKIAPLLPKDCIKISESSIHTKEDIRELQKFGFDGFLIGEAFMKTNDPVKACAKLIKEARN